MIFIERIILKILLVFQIDRIIRRLSYLGAQLKVLRYKQRGVEIKFIPQGEFDFEIMGEISRFHMAATSHLKSGTYIDVNGGVTIGEYFHTGRGLTIFSTYHDYKNATCIPYDDVVLQAPVSIGDFVWCGANVTILPGVTVGEGAILAAGSVISQDVAPLAIVGGNPAKVIKYRDGAQFHYLKSNGKFY